MKLRGFCLVVLSLLVLPFLAVSAYADSLGPTLSTYAVLGGASVTNAGVAVLGATLITGNLGVSPGSSITGFPPGIVVDGTIHNNDVGPGSAAEAQGQLTTAYTTLGALFVPPTNVIAAGGLSGNSLNPGVYSVSSTAFDLTANSTLTLTGTGMFVFIMSSSLISGSGATVDVSALGAGSSVFWIVRSSATLGDNADFAGNILALTSIGFDPGATDLCGRALARNGSVTFAGQNATTSEENQVGGNCALGNVSGTGGTSGGGLNGGGGGTGGGGGGSLPEPGTLLPFGIGIAGLFVTRMKRAK